MQDGQETDVDCGGPTCPACVLGDTCKVDRDCQSDRCSKGVCVDGIVVSQIQSRGVNGGNDDFIEIYNPGTVAVTFDKTWTLGVRSAISSDCTTTALGTRWTGANQVIPPHGHLLLGNGMDPGYTPPPTADATYASGVPDAASVVLFHGSTVVDAVCFYYDSTTESALLSCSTPYTCLGTPVKNPHDNTSSTDTDEAIERLPGGSGGNTQNTGDNAADFDTITTADPHDLASPAVP